MFTLDQINDIHDRLGSADTLTEYLLALRDIGITSYDSFITDGHSEYHGADTPTLVSLPTHEILTIADVADKAAFREHLRLHEAGQTSYLDMSKALAESGVEKWTFDTRKLTIACYDKAGNQMKTEPI